MLTALAVLLLAAPPVAPAVDTTSLAPLLAGVKLPADFKAVVVTFAPGEVAGQWFGYNETADDLDWYPASSIKVFPAVAALEAMEARSLGIRTRIAFDRPGQKPYVRTLEELVRQTLSLSSNLGYDRLVQLVGADALHTDLLGEARGFEQTAVQIAYSQNVVSVLESPAITLGQGATAQVIPAREAELRARCPQAMSCTSVAALAELMRRIMLHETLPEGDRLHLGAAAIGLLRSALEARKPRGTEVADALAAAFAPRPVRVLHKPGFFPYWRSDVVYGEVGGQRWIVALAGRGGRDTLTAAAQRIGRLLASRRLKPGKIRGEPE